MAILDWESGLCLKPGNYWQILVNFSNQLKYQIYKAIWSVLIEDFIKVQWQLMYWKVQNKEHLQPDLFWFQKLLHRRLICASMVCQNVTFQWLAKHHLCEHAMSLFCLIRNKSQWHKQHLKPYCMFQWAFPVSVISILQLCVLFHIRFIRDWWLFSSEQSDSHSVVYEVNIK